jgi:hypothetical protein
MSENTTAFVVQLLYTADPAPHTVSSVSLCEVPLRINTKLDPILSIPSAVQAAHNLQWIFSILLVVFKFGDWFTTQPPPETIPNARRLLSSAASSSLLDMCAAASTLASS